MPNRLCQKIRKLLGAIQHNGRFKDKRAVFQMAAHAERTVTCLHGLQPDVDERQPAGPRCSVSRHDGRGIFERRLVPTPRISQRLPPCASL